MVLETNKIQVLFQARRNLKIKLLEQKCIINYASQTGFHFFVSFFFAPFQSKKK